MVWFVVMRLDVLFWKGILFVIYGVGLESLVIKFFKEFGLVKGGGDLC